jgi:chromosome segregation ATPase
MTQLRLEADQAAANVEELQAKVKALEQDNLAKEQEVTSLQHKNGLLEAEVEKLEASLKDLKKGAEDSQHAGTQNEALARRLALLEEEAEQADKTLREANDKYVFFFFFFFSLSRSPLCLAFEGRFRPACDAEACVGCSCSYSMLT